MEKDHSGGGQRWYWGDPSLPRATSPPVVTGLVECVVSSCPVVLVNQVNRVPSLVDISDDHRTWTERVVVWSIHRQSIHHTYHTCGGKIWIFFLVRFRPSFTPLLDTPFPCQKLFFSFKKSNQSIQKNEETVEILSLQLPKGLPYSSRRTGDQWSLESTFLTITRSCDLTLIIVIILWYFLKPTQHVWWIYMSHIH